MATARRRSVALTPNHVASVAAYSSTLVVGIAGAFIGGLIGDVILGHKVHYSFDLVPFLLAVVGAVVLLLALQALAGRRRPYL